MDKSLRPLNESINKIQTNTDTEESTHYNVPYSQVVTNAENNDYVYRLKQHCDLTFCTDKIQERQLSYA